MSIEHLYMKSPCGNCPFRKDCLRGWLGEERAQEITSSDSFVCHKNNDKQCYGAMKLLPQNTFRQLGERMGLVRLKDSDKIFSLVEDMINHHKKLENE